ncbi:MAG: Sec-independent protein translocase protein TatB [Pseudomonadota bacterium]|jgi:sec-independent protein translocase protein TatB
MFDIGWDEMALIAAVSLIVIGPKDLPTVLRQVGRWTRKARDVAGEFHRGVDEMLRESELADLKQQVARAADPALLRQEIDRAIDPDGELTRAMTLTPAPPPAAAPAALAVTAPAPVEAVPAEAAPEPIPPDQPAPRPPAP